MITYADDFDAKFSLWLKAANPHRFLSMQEATTEVESNILAANKLKVEEGRGGKDKKKVKEERHPSTSKAISSEEKLDEMSNLIKHLTSKMYKLELENKVVVRPTHEGMNINQVPFRRPFQPQQILKKDRSNLDDQKVQPPLNNFAGENQQDHEEEYDEIHLIGG